MKPSIYASHILSPIHTTRRLPEAAQAMVDAYLHIRVDGAIAACPYHINAGLRSAGRALLGKGTPQEIESLARKYLGSYDMRPKDSEDLRLQMAFLGLGIDCSGFAAWVLNEVTLDKLGRPLWQCLRFPGLKRSMISKLRPVQNISANVLTGPVNAERISDLSTVLPGDLLRIDDWHHVMVVTAVDRDETGKAREFEFAQSSCMYGSESGVRLGRATIMDPMKPLGAQRWSDGSEDERLTRIISRQDNSYAVRLKALS